MSTALRRLVKWGYVSLAMLLIGLAVIVQMGRSFSHLIADYNQPISDYLSETLNARVSVESIDAQWDGLRPSLSVEGLRIANHQDEVLISLQNAQVRFDILRSLFSRGVVWNSILLSNVELDFEQTVDGKWRLQGFLHKEPESKITTTLDKEAFEKGGVNIDQLLDMFLLSNRIEFVSTKLRFVFLEGQEVLLHAPSLLLENADDFHRLTLSVDAGEEQDNLHLVLEGQGDPRDRENFRSKGYLEITSLPTREALAATSDFLFHGMDYEFLKGDGDIQAKIWLESVPDGSGYDLSGQLDLQRIEVAAGKTSVQLDDVSTKILGRWNFDENWMLQLQQLQSKFGDNNLREVSINIDYEKVKSEVNLAFDQVNLQQLYGLLDASGALGQGRLNEILKELNLRGNLMGMQMSIPLAAPKDWQLRSQLRDVYVDHWRGVPKLTALDGYVTATADDGAVWINSGKNFSMHFVPTYESPMTFDEARGQVAWHIRPDENRVYVNSGALRFSQDTAQLVGYMLLDIPLNAEKEDTHRIDLTLQISAQNLPISHYQTYVPSGVPQSLSHWLDEAIGQNNPGIATQVGLLYRADIASKDADAKMFNLFIDTQATHLAYHSGWPELKDVAGKILIRDANVDATIKQGSLLNSFLSQTQLSVRPLEGEEGAQLFLKGDLVGPGADILTSLREGQLRETLGDNMDSWVLTGNATTQVDLTLPIGVQNSKRSEQLTDFMVATHLSDSSLRLANLNLNFNDLTGQILYTHQDGFKDTRLMGNLFSNPLTAEIKTKTASSSNNKISHIALTGKVASQTLAQWSQRPELYFLQGNIGVDVTVDLFHGVKPRDKAELINAQLPQSLQHFSKNAFAKVNVTSDLNGVLVSLPGDLLKAANEKAELSFDVWLQPSAWQLDVRYQDKINTLIHLDAESKKLLNASVGLNRLADFSSTPEFLISGDLAEFDIQLWKNVLSRYNAYQSELNAVLNVKPELDANTDDSAVRGVAGLPFRAQVNLAKHNIGPVELSNLWVEATPIAYGWSLQLKNDMLEGQVTLPDSQYLPLELDIEHLYLPKNALSKSSAIDGDETSELIESHNTDTDAVADTSDSAHSTSAKATSQSSSDVLLENKSQEVNALLSASDLPAARVNIQNLYLAEESLGHWVFEIKPTSQGVVIDSIQGTIRGLSFSGNPELNDEGARLIWRDAGGVNESRFIGRVTATNLADVSKQWQVPELLESESARFIADIHWQGAPADIQLVNLSGKVELSLHKGRFYRNAGAGDGLLRLMSVVNFDSIARRLKLDFSDLYQSGLAYDSVEGELSFHQGIMRLSKPLDLKGPSSRLQLAGNVDLKQEQINSRLIATLPVAGNLTFAAALITGLPAAVGVYVVSKLFKKQVDRATSISYEIKGSWDEPVVRFTRFFESEESLSQLDTSVYSSKDGVAVAPEPQQDTRQGASSTSQHTSEYKEDADEVDIEALEALIQEGVKEVQNEEKAP